MLSRPPWRVLKQGVEDAEGMPICVGPGIEDLTLIAAAPELLEACKVSMLFIESLWREAPRNVYDVTRTCQAAAVIGALRKAIEKAERG